MTSINIEWGEIFNVGDKQLDAEHHQQFHLIQQFCESCNKKQGCDKSEQKRYLNKLIDLAEDHFLAEEEALRIQHGATPGDHSTEHNNLLKEVILLEQTLDETNDEDTASTYPGILIGWFVRHMMLHDKIDCHSSRIQ